MLPTVRQDDERRLHILCVAPGLLFGIVWVDVFALRFDDAQHSTVRVLQEIVSASTTRVQFKLNLLGVQWIPIAELKRLINERHAKTLRCRWS
jgi:hypothetical protein